MDPKEYQGLASRTECDQEASRRRISGYAPNLSGLPDHHLMAVRVNHSVVGMSGEVGELASVVQKWLYYGKLYSLQDLRDKFKDELGDLLWYASQACNALGLDLGEVMAANVRKLQARYPGQYSDILAADENRDRDAEARALKGGD